MSQRQECAADLRPDPDRPGVAVCALGHVWVPIYPAVPTDAQRFSEALGREFA